MGCGIIRLAESRVDAAAAMPFTTTIGGANARGARGVCFEKPMAGVENPVGSSEVRRVTAGRACAARRVEEERCSETGACREPLSTRTPGRNCMRGPGEVAPSRVGDRERPVIAEAVRLRPGSSGRLKDLVTPGARPAARCDTCGGGFTIGAREGCGGLSAPGRRVVPKRAIDRTCGVSAPRGCSGLSAPWEKRDRSGLCA